MNNPAIFKFESQDVRIITMGDRPIFVAQDLCKILEISNASQALSRLDDDEKVELSRDSILILNNDPNTVRLSGVTESGMYALVLTSRKPAAKSFRKWVTAEVLPAIRKTGTYSVQSAPQTRMEMLAEIAQQMVEQERQLKQHSQVLDELVANKEQAEKELKALPLSADAPAEIPTRGRINMIVRNSVRRSNAAYSAIWDKLYLELYYRYKFDTKARCRHSGRKPLDQIEADGMLDALYAIASEVLA